MEDISTTDKMCIYSGEMRHPSGTTRSRRLSDVLSIFRSWSRREGGGGEIW